jgi:hypothetical protein
MAIPQCVVLTVWRTTPELKGMMNLRWLSDNRFPRTKMFGQHQETKLLGSEHGLGKFLFLRGLLGH